MKKPMVKIHNVETGEVIEREMNAEELEQFEIDQAVTNAMKQAEQDKVIAKLELLEKLGITEDEAKLLLS